MIDICTHLVTTVFRFDQLLSLGKRVGATPRPKSGGSEVGGRLRQLTQERAALKESWEKRNKQLKQCSELQVKKTCLLSIRCMFPELLVHTACSVLWNESVHRSVSSDSLNCGQYYHTVTRFVPPAFFYCLLPFFYPNLNSPYSKHSSFFEMWNSWTQSTVHMKPSYPTMTLGYVRMSPS